MAHGGGLAVFSIEHAKTYPGPIVILVHCFGGMNRSSSALCALLIIFRQMSARQAIQQLVTARPGLNYWENRLYFVEALRDLHVQVRLAGALCGRTVGPSGLSGVAP